MVMVGTVLGLIMTVGDISADKAQSFESFKLVVTAIYVGVAAMLLAIAALFQIFDGMQAIAAGALRGYRDTTVPLLLAVIGYWGIGFAGGWLLAFPAGYGPIGLWSGLAVGLAAVALMLTIAQNRM